MQPARILALAAFLFALTVSSSSFSSAEMSVVEVLVGYIPSALEQPPVSSKPSYPAAIPEMPSAASVKCAPAVVTTKNGFIPGSAVDSAIQRTAEFYKIDPYAICAVIKRESNFDGAALGNSGEVGLMQVMPSTAKSECGLDSSQLWDVNVNIRCGAKVFAKYLSLCGNNYHYAACAYNAGPGNVGCRGNAGDRLFCPVSSGKAKPYAYARAFDQNFNYFKRG